MYAVIIRVVVPPNRASPGSPFYLVRNRVGLRSEGTVALKKVRWPEGDDVRSVPTTPEEEYVHRIKFR